MQGSCFTWSNNRKSASWARLDRFLVSPIAFSWFHNILQKSLPRNLSNHNAILPGESSMDWGPIPFRIFNSWLEDKGLIKEAGNAWRDWELEFNGITCSEPSQIRAGILNFFKDHLKKEKWKRPLINNLVLRQLLKEEREALEAEFSED
ncbi:hypothetical protein Dsin_002173 [Dipteronia sinensis]|uniref:Uncharacterized protein n=1 Tax=Dipteronia sinensis TaxID=43782 RepID=A0AAE0B6N6_9ROSI|nr:hypothetical protein Dsin_002173 [Dipteronia sinensis]